MLKRAFWAAAWRLTLLGLVALAIALMPTPSSVGIEPALEHVDFTPRVSQPRQPATTEVVQPVKFAEGDWHYQDGQFRKTPHHDDSLALKSSLLTASAADYVPREEIAPADPSNYGPRFLTDIYGRPASNALVVIVHETVGSADSAINTMQRYHANDNDQVSYHSIIRRDGTIVHLVHPQMRAFGAGNSVFSGPNGPESVQTNPNFPPSVNNFAYHTSLETPSDGRGNQSGHSGYTEAQYRSLGWLVSRLPVPDDRVTTHQAVDRSGLKRDPRSFSRQTFLNRLHLFPRVSY